MRTGDIHWLVASRTGRPMVACGAPHAERAACALVAVTCPACRRAAPATLPAPLARAREADLLSEVIMLATQYGWLCYHVRHSMQSAAGFPDVIAVKAGHPVLCLELKSAVGRVTPEQQVWIDTFQQAQGIIAAIIRPQDMARVMAWLSGHEKPSSAL